MFPNHILLLGLMVGCVFCAPAAEIVSPKDGHVVTLLSDAQREVMALPLQKERSAFLKRYRQTTEPSRQTADGRWTPCQAGLVYRGQGLNESSATGERPGRNRMTVEDVRLFTEQLGIRTDLDLRMRLSHLDHGFAKYGKDGDSWNRRVELYLHACGVTEEEIRTFREIMLEKRED